MVKKKQAKSTKRPLRHVRHVKKLANIPSFVVIVVAVVLFVTLPKPVYETYQGLVTQRSSDQLTDGGVSFAVNGKKIMLCGVRYLSAKKEVCPSEKDQYIPENGDIVEVKLLDGKLEGCQQCYVRKIK